MSADPPTTSRGATAKELFLEAIELEGTERERFLDALRRREPDTAERVAALVAAHDGATANSLESLGGSVRGLLAGPVGEAGAVIGDYELVEELAHGASGVVWRARQRSLDRVVALKVLRAGHLAGRREVERFRAEAEAVARFHHPRIVPVYEIGEHEGRHFFSMRLFEGGSLAERVGEERPWDPREAAALVRTIARTVHHAHQRGILHRDLKPSNVLLDEHGGPHVADFGIAAPIDASGVAAVTATLAGTPSYMAPEQTGVGSEDLTVAADVWSLGCILYELLTGRPPFTAESMAELLEVVRTQPPFPLRALRPDAPRDLETIALRCLAKEPGRRYASANALAVDLGRWLEHEPILARRTGPLERFTLAWRRSPVSTTLAIAVALLLVAIAAIASWGSLALSGRLRDSLLGEARATRLSAVAGRRARALDLIEQAARIRTGADLRDEAIACLALTDIEPVDRMPLSQGADRMLAISDDLSKIVYRHDDGRIAVSSLPEEEVELFLNPGGSCDHLRFSPDGSLLFARIREDDGRRTGRVFALPSGEEILYVPNGWASRSVDLSPDGRHVLLGQDDGKLRALRLADGEPVMELEFEAYIAIARFRGDGGAFAVYSATDEARLEVRAFPSGELLSETELPARPHDLRWALGDTACLIGAGDFNAYVVRPGDEAPPLAFEGHNSEVVNVFASEESGLLITGSWDRTLRVWSLATGAELLVVSGNLRRASADGRRIAYATVEGVVRADVVHGDVLWTLHGHAGKSPVSVTFTRDGKHAATFGLDQALWWDLERGVQAGVLAPVKTDGVEASPDGRWLYVSSTEGLERRSTDAPLEPGEFLFQRDMDHCDLSADGELFVARDALRLFAFHPDRVGDAIEFPGYSGIEYVVASAKGNYIAGMTWRGDGTTIWRPDGEVIGRLREARRTIGVAIAPDESRIVVSDGVNYEVYTLPALELVRTLERDSPMRESPGTLTFSEDGALLAIGNMQSKIDLYDGRTYERVASLESVGATFTGRPTFSPDGSVLAVPSPNNRLYLWDLAALDEELAALGLGWR